MSKAMGKAISDFQRTILLLADEKGIVTYTDIISWFWDRDPAEWGNKESGSPEYNRMYASTSRAVDRLWRRGLVEIWKSLTKRATGVSLTTAGKELVVSISGEESKDG